MVRNTAFENGSLLLTLKVFSPQWRDMLAHVARITRKRGVAGSNVCFDAHAEPSKIRMQFDESRLAFSFSFNSSARHSLVVRNYTLLLKIVQQAYPKPSTRNIYEPG